MNELAAMRTMHECLVSGRLPIFVTERASIPDNFSRNIQPLHTQDRQDHSRNQHHIAQGEEIDQFKFKTWN